jgi:hypothetical protein
MDYFGDHQKQIRYAGKCDLKLTLCLLIEFQMTGFVTKAKMVSTYFNLTVLLTYQ